jgi:hypothetical protein
MSVMTLDDLQALAGGDENEGPVEDRIAVVSARAELAGRGVSVSWGLALLGAREIEALAEEAADPIAAIAARVTIPDPEPEPDPKQGGQHVLDNPPGR